MLLVPGPRQRFCDGINRRSFLRVGGLGLAGLNLADVLRADAASPVRRPNSVIMVFLPGGPSHMDLVDLKPDAPVEFRGEFRPIHTAVPGLQVSELLPNLATMLDKVALLRTIVGGVDDHACHICLTGHNRTGPQPAGNWPTLGAVAGRLLGATVAGVPPSVGLAAKMLHPPYNDPGPGFLGPAYTPFSPDGECRDNMTLHGLDLARLGERKSLLSAFDRFRRSADGSSVAEGMEAFQRQAFEVLTSPNMALALDLSHEDRQTRQRYGAGDASLIPGFNAAPKLTEQLLVARRLVEAGARCVTLAFGGWDWHEKNFVGLRQETPLLDQGLAALIGDLHDRGLEKQVAVVVWGEFGRSPRINKAAGRDHWPSVSCALLAGGGWRTGQAIGATNRLAEIPAQRPVHVLEVFSTLYRHLGIDSDVALTDLASRPQYLVDQARPLAELI